MTFYERIQQIKTKSRLKAAFRRKPKPARVKLEDEFNDVAAIYARDTRIVIEKHYDNKD